MHPRRRLRWLGLIAVAALAAACSGDDAPALETGATERVEIVIVGDSYTEGVVQGGLGDANWTAQLAGLLRADGYRVAVTVEAGGGSGYVSPGWRNLTFGQMVDLAVGPSADVVVVLGSINDMGIGASADEVRAAAAATYAAVSTTAPDASLVVVGPSPTGDEIPSALRDVSRGVAEAARAAGATFVDPIDRGWFSGDAAALISDDALHPTDDGHVYMAEQLVDDIEAVIDERSGN